jgi:hypothetical protein
MRIVKLSICDTISSRLEEMIQEVESFRYLIQDQIDGVRNSLIELRDAVAFSTMEEMNQAFSAISANIDFIIVPVEKFDEIIDIIDICGFLKVDPFFSNPAILASYILDTLKSRCMDALFDITDIPEILLSRSLVDIGALLPSIGIDSTILRSRLLIQCIENFCGWGVASSYQRLLSVLDTTYVTHLGVFDPIALMNSVNLESEVVENVNSSINTVSNIYLSVENNCNTAIESFKERFPT